MNETVTKKGVETTYTTDSPDTDPAKWFTIESPYFLICPCPYIRRYVHATFPFGCFIIVWPEKDDPNLLKYAAETQQEIEKHGMDDYVKVVEYESALGPCISWYQLAELEAV